ncbi:pyroglutamyl-peptidase I [Bombilactobacillus bombi]|uniref:pyroglutamyl-peptidase I n=1 Tax=Bombilactobacillus bombi TaxID=1303590 RepID=UPI000E576725|nr:pyroglutamyl-peptidase I [Bombilactobacillus bombi]AXX65371.1 pyroglutamyl-peptidase I [Bombilactobacillus bombi]
MKILVTGFNPFGKEPINPAIEAVKLLPESINNAHIVKLEIPTEFNKCVAVVKKEVELQQPDYVINIGQAGGRAAITPERVAINLDDGRIPDNAGYQPHNQTIQESGPTAYFTQLPLQAMVDAIHQAGLPAEISNTAGTYVCNHIFYQMQYLREHEFPQIKAGFIHIPFLPAQVIKRPNAPSLSLADSVRGLTAALVAITEANN